MTTLLLSSRATEDNQAMWRAAIARDWDVERARGIRIPEINDSEIVLYVESLYAPTIADRLGLRLMEVPEDWLASLPREFTRRSIDLATLGVARSLTTPTFVKPPNDKSFAARVYENGSALPDAFDDAMTVLVSEPVAWDAEFRCFALDGRVRTLSPYLRRGALSRADGFSASDEELTAAQSLADEVLAIHAEKTPNAVVIDVGRLDDGNWAVVEANAAWGSGIYGCDPDVVLEVIRRAVTVA
ncbi:MAG: ATP-grasp domain-containing protein [Phycisphaerales bacterium]|nr:ATP-grasp domain-containing protein [Phycisphaerales bacterium]